MNKKKLVFFTCFALLASSALYIFYKNEPDDISHNEHPPQNKKTVLTHDNDLPHSPSSSTRVKENVGHDVDIKEQLENIKKFCENEFPRYKGKFPSVEVLNSALKDSSLTRMWLNLHLKSKDKRVWRVRRFLDDGPNGSIERVILYKEDETGFPRIVDSSENYKNKKASEIFEEFKSKGNVIFSDEAYSVLKNGVDYFFELTNGQITRIDVTSTQDHINCEVPH